MANVTVRVVSGNFLTARLVGIVDGVDSPCTAAGAQGRFDGHAQGHRHRRAGAAFALRLSPTGEAFNPSMEDVATSAAMALQADKLLFITEIPGIHEKADDPERTRSTPSSRWPTPSGCWPRCPRPCSPATRPSTCATARRPAAAASSARHILPFAEDGALLLEVFTHDGIGTMVVDEKLESLREASADDIGGILQLIDPSRPTARWSSASRTEIERDIGHYTGDRARRRDLRLRGAVRLPEARTGEMAA